MMKVLLTQTIEKTGIVGEVISVSEGFARNYLLPKKLAIEPTEGNIKRLEAAKLEYERQQKLLREQKEKLVAAITGVEIAIERASNEEGHLFGSVSRRDIADELQKLGHAVEPDDVRLDEPLRRIDTFMVKVQVAGDLATQIKVWVVRDKSAPAQGAVDETAAAATADEAAGQASAPAAE
ncbi:MAG: 50S ribosomal protein L9 [Phycisphaerae bacterium]